MGFEQISIVSPNLLVCTK